MRRADLHARHGLQSETVEGDVLAPGDAPREGRDGWCPQEYRHLLLKNGLLLPAQRERSQKQFCLVRRCSSYHKKSLALKNIKKKSDEIPCLFRHFLTRQPQNKCCPTVCTTSSRCSTLLQSLRYLKFYVGSGIPYQRHVRLSFREYITPYEKTEAENSTREAFIVSVIYVATRMKVKGLEEGRIEGYLEVAS